MSNEYTWQYTTVGFHLPAPVLRINISNIADQNLNSSEDFLIDSGSDISFIRKELFSTLRLGIVDDVEFEVADTEPGENKIKKRDVTEVKIGIPEINVDGTIQLAIGERGETNLLGRDFLDSFEVLLNRGQDFTIRR